MGGTHPEESGRQAVPIPQPRQGIWSDPRICGTYRKRLQQGGEKLWLGQQAPVATSRSGRGRQMLYRREQRPRQKPPPGTCRGTVISQALGPHLDDRLTLLLLTSCSDFLAFGPKAVTRKVKVTQSAWPGGAEGSGSGAFSSPCSKQKGTCRHFLPLSPP